MYKAIVLGGLLALAGGVYAADDAPAGSDQQAAATTTTTTTTTTAQPVQYDFAASKLIGKKVINSQGEDVGSIDDVIVGQDEKVSHAIIAVGGVLGIGKHLVAVPFDELNMQGDQVVYGTATKDQLASMPQFQYKEDLQKAERAEQQRAEAPVPGGPATGGTGPSGR